MAETNAVRPGEEIDVVRLAAFLSSELGLDTDEIVVEQFPAGSSNLTYLVLVGRTEYVLRRPPFVYTVQSALDMHKWDTKTIGGERSSKCAIHVAYDHHGIRSA